MSNEVSGWLNSNPELVTAIMGIVGRRDHALMTMDDLVRHPRLQLLFVDDHGMAYSKLFRALNLLRETGRIEFHGSDDPRKALIGRSASPVLLPAKPKPGRAHSLQ